MAKQISPIISPPLGPTIPPPIIRPVSASKISFVKPWSQPLAIARPDAAHGKLALVILMPCSLAAVSVIPTQATSGDV